MEIKQIQHSGWLHIRAEGRLDSQGSVSYSSVVLDSIRAGERKLRLDLERVTYLSSAGIRVLARAVKELRAAGGECWIHPVSETVQSVLSLAGLQSLLKAPANPPELPSELVFGGSGEAEPSSSAHDLRGSGFAKFEVRWKEPRQSLLGRHLGSSSGIFGTEYSLERLVSAPDRIAIGLGAMGKATDPLGEFVLVGESLIGLPAVPFSKPDFLVAQEELLPEIHAFSGLALDGELGCFIRFEAAPGQAVSLSSIAKRALDACGAHAVGLVLVAECSGLVGASLRQPPGRGEAISFTLDALRESIVFASEKTYPHSLALIVGTVSQPGTFMPEEIKAQLRTISEEELGHFHAVVFPPRFVPRGELKLKETVQYLLETGLPEDLLHLVNDDRSDGAGESEFTSGAGWCGPIGKL